MNKIIGELPDNHISNETLWIYKDNIEIFKKYNQQVIHHKPEIKEIKETKKTSVKSKIESPIDLIMRLTATDRNMKQDIRNKLIDFISIPEFTKVFGMKKTGEIMTALSKDSWNQSISLFISFLLDKNIIYKDKSYIYNKEKENQTITI
jgi:hypothetical protein|uniref:Uncharacterized protein n=1 Tax=viral metagenome TaxID=1070528 RepID=A0A6C0DL95_9ZZZZ